MVACNAESQTVRYEQLWAPWRLAYVTGYQSDSHAAEEAGLSLLPGADPSCFICRAVVSRRDRENLVVYRGKSTVAIINRFPYNNGHLLVAPGLHKGRLEQLTPDERLECIDDLTCLSGLLERLMRAEGFNFGLNLGKVAGAGLPGHLHWHIVPRWHGDTNFMPVMAGIRTIPQSLDALWDLLTEGLAKGAEAEGIVPPPPFHS